jgi:hypothetical protein
LFIGTLEFRRDSGELLKTFRQKFHRLIRDRSHWNNPTFRSVAFSEIGSGKFEKLVTSDRLVVLSHSS